LLGQHLGASHHDSSTRESGKIVRLGESGVGRVQSSPDIIHDQKTIYGSWVTSTWLMEELVEELVRWNLASRGFDHAPVRIEGRRRCVCAMASGRCGKVAVCLDEELAAEGHEVIAVEALRSPRPITRRKPLRHAVVFKIVGA
jgi:hypothetical protein